MPQEPEQPFPSRELGAWLFACGFPAAPLSPLAGDVSPRRYFRGRSADGRPFVLALYPADGQAGCRRFLATSRLLASGGVPVPAVLAADCERGFMLVEDVGEETLYDLRHRPWEELAPYLESALDLAGRIAALPAGAVEGLSPPLDGALLRRELDHTWEALLAPEGLTGDAPCAARLARAFDELCAALGAEPMVPCHRDFMARNLVPRRGPAPLLAAAAAGSGAELWVLDHQDLRLGPAPYDLASLLNDSLFPPPQLEARLLARALPPGAPRAAYHRAAAQRTLKAAGTFAAFAARGSRRHLPLVPPTLGRALAHLSRLPESAPLVPALERAWAGRFC